MVAGIVLYPMRFAQLFDNQMRPKQALQIPFGLKQILRRQPILFGRFLPVQNVVVLGHGSKLLKSE